MCRWGLLLQARQTGQAVAFTNKAPLVLCLVHKSARVIGFRDLEHLHVVRCARFKVGARSVARTDSAGVHMDAPI